MQRCLGKTGWCSSTLQNPTRGEHRTCLGPVLEDTEPAPWILLCFWLFTGREGRGGRQMSQDLGFCCQLQGGGGNSGDQMTHRKAVWKRGGEICEKGIWNKVLGGRILYVAIVMELFWGITRRKRTAIQGRCSNLKVIMCGVCVCQEIWNMGALKFKSQDTKKLWWGCLIQSCYRETELGPVSTWCAMLCWLPR